MARQTAHLSPTHEYSAALPPALDTTMSSKHIFDSPQGLVLKSLRGAVVLNPPCALTPTPNKLHLPFPFKPEPKRRLVVISGGGVDRQPAHVGYTGQGMPSTSVSGDIFPSPSAKAV
ncbi:hypothetical protein JAAARDRAFT_189793 [Jaapia argillacea MUCL 33604]|uniref:DhaK domain-containing protein n=1 Tax=Jaapia argillacea MUCL 33604 TaxID=933084 RepID=A0A067QIQ4_9AGAM|nr:hypothetical protein JAAARDRAFT_189793 [Jaapia argillacea MUCL 33604]